MIETFLVLFLVFDYGYKEQVIHYDQKFEDQRACARYIHTEKYREWVKHEYMGQGVRYIWPACKTRYNIEQEA